MLSKLIRSCIFYWLHHIIHKILSEMAIHVPRVVKTILFSVALPSRRVKVYQRPFLRLHLFLIVTFSNADIYTSLNGLNASLSVVAIFVFDPQTCVNEDFLVLSGLQ